MSESVAPAPVVGERVVTQPAVADYTVGTRVRDAYALAPMPQAVVATVPNVRSYRYMVINNRLLLVDPATGYVVADMTEVRPPAAAMKPNTCSGGYIDQPPAQAATQFRGG